LSATTPPLSKEVYKYLAGYEFPAGAEGAPAQARVGQFDLFSNYDPATLQPRARPPTLLIDSDALENSGQIDEGFRRVFAPEIEIFKREYARVHGAAAAEEISDAEILRQVVNTVGQRGSLAPTCAASSVGIRKFGSQLLCEQVAGRALRRRSYQLRPYDETTGDITPQEFPILVLKRATAVVLLLPVDVPDQIVQATPPDGKDAVAAGTPGITGAGNAPRLSAKGAPHTSPGRSPGHPAPTSASAESASQATVEKKAYLYIGPKFGTVSKQAVGEAIKACRDQRDGDWLLILGFAFESGITELSRHFGTFQVSIVRMHDDLLQQGLLKKDKKAQAS
jgi:hypothetical protein